ncbi:MAG: hypothetical protein IKR85_11590 [Clostridia bacterium]|nr:hypothetical protein [Clostridia bacterium]
MNPRLKCALKLLCALVIAALSFTAGRAAGIYLLRRLFETLNLTARTYAYARAWMRYLWDNANGLVLLCGGLTLFCALLFVRDMFPAAGRVFRIKWLLLPFAAATLGYFAVRLLEDTDIVRRAGSFPSAGALEYVLLFVIVTDVCLLSYEVTFEAVRGGFGKAAAYAAPAVLFTLLRSADALLTGEYFAYALLGILNGMLALALGAYLYDTQRSIYPPLLTAFGFTAGHRYLAGFPDYGAFAVNPGVLTGDSGGLNSSAALTLMLLGACALVFISVKRNKPNG